MRRQIPPVLAVACAVSILGLIGTAQEAKEPPAALIIAASGGHILRAGSALPLAAKNGDILFANDELRADGGSVTFLSCSGTPQQQSLSGDGDVLFDVKGLKLRTGKFADQKPAAGCFLPPLPRTIVAGQAHVGASVAEARTREMSPTTFEQRVKQLEPAKQTQLTAALGPIDTALRANPSDTVKRLERANLLDQYGLKADAAAEMDAVSKAWPDAAWPKSRLFVLTEDDAKAKLASAPPSQPEVEGKTYALLVGVSNFKDDRINKLDYAHLDANDLTSLLESPRAGAIPPENLVLLTNEKATTAAIRGAIDTHLKGKAGKDDTVLLFIASHGAAVPVNGKTKGFVITYDTSPEDPASSGIPMDDIRKLFEDELTKVRRLLLYVDVCHAGRIGQIESRLDVVAKTAERDFSSREVDLFGILAAQGGQYAFESVNFGGGHGAFTYFLMKALNGDADLNRDGKVTMDELFQFVQDRVQEATAHHQIPKQIGDIDENRVMAITDRKGIDLKEYTGPVNTASRSIPRTKPAAISPALAPLNSPLTARTLRNLGDKAGAVKRFEDALEQGRILPAEDQSAFTFLEALRALLKADEYAIEAEKLRVALEDRGQQVLLTYLAGEQIPQKRDDFLQGQAYFEAAQNLAPKSLLLQSRSEFCRGRVAIFDKNYPLAATLLERSVRLDPDRAYAYNALGISYLERADYDRAILAFRDASARAPYWAYPLHNMALAYSEQGDYDAAIRTYQRAMRLVPAVAYLPYNLGLLYQRMNRPRDAEAMYREAQRIAPGNPQAFNALGYLRASQGKSKEAEDYYRQALAADSGLLVARHNLALLLSGLPERGNEAVTLWRENLAKAKDYVPSRLSLARFLERTGQNDAAASEYTVLVQTRPVYIAARLALADVDARIGRPDDALAQLREAIKLEPRNPALYERLGDVAKGVGHKADAESAYQKAIEYSTEKADKRRIQRKAGI
jgi:tetratricopeptide (TPR) repeat protein